MLRIACAVVLACACAGVQAKLAIDAAAAQVQARLAPVTVLRGRFEQEKHVTGFRNALRSSGDFLIARGRGVVWATRAPFASTLVLTPEQMSVVQADGSRQSLAGGQGGRAVAMVNGLMLALMTGDTATLGKRFRLEPTLRDDGAWTLVLVPRDGALKKAFARIELEGGRHVEAVHLIEAGGDRTDLKFLDLRDTPATLTATEAAQFD
jgi:outer membrane lipoprotein-sorting protein